MCVSDFGPLPCSIITTTRKFFTVLASVVIFGNALSQRQWVGAAFVFAGAFKKANSLEFKRWFEREKLGMDQIARSMESPSRNKARTGQRFATGFFKFLKFNWYCISPS